MIGREPGYSTQLGRLKVLDYYLSTKATNYSKWFPLLVRLLIKEPISVDDEEVYFPISIHNLANLLNSRYM